RRENPHRAVCVSNRLIVRIGYDEGPGKAPRLRDVSRHSTTASDYSRSAAASGAFSVLRSTASAWRFFNATALSSSCLARASCAAADLNSRSRTLGSAEFAAAARAASALLRWAL